MLPIATWAKEILKQLSSVIVRLTDIERKIDRLPQSTMSRENAEEASNIYQRFPLKTMEQLQSMELDLAEADNVKAVVSYLQYLDLELFFRSSGLVRAKS